MNKKLLQKFYKGECSEKEVQEVVHWFSNKPQKEVLMEQLAKDWDQFEIEEDEKFPGYNPDDVLNNIHTRIRADNKFNINAYNVNPIRTKRFYYLRVACIVLLALFSVSIIQMLISKTPVMPVANLATEALSGEKRSLVLEDGTKVYLNSGSKLVYPEKFKEDKREIILEGEAFFEVAKDPQRPFIIVSDNIETTVIGTSFNIKAYPNEKNIQVSVVSGKVKVNNGKEVQYLLPGNAANYNFKDSLLTELIFDQEEVLAWKEGVLYLKDCSYEEVAIALGRWYGVEIEAVGEGIHGWNYTGKFHDQSLENVLKSIGYVKNFEYKISENKVRLIF